MNNKSNIFVFSLLLLLGYRAALANSGTRSVETTTTISASPEELLNAFLDDDDLKA